MPLYIKDDAVAELARRTKEATGARTVTEAVRVALEKALAEAKTSRSPLDRFAEALAIADAMGPSDHSVDMKQFMDDLYDE